MAVISHNRMDGGYCNEEEDDESEWLLLSSTLVSPL